jgi:hypothetical protein
MSMDEITRSSSPDWPGWQRWMAWAGLFALILIVRWSVLDSPPYFDFALGIWREAEYLARTGFDYRSLRYECDTSSSEMGGPRCYMISAIPTFLAVGYRTLPLPTGPVIAYHLVVFAVAALSVVIFYEMLRERMGVFASLAGSLALITTPILCVQVDMLGFEMLLVTTAMLWLRSMSKQRYGWAIVWSIAGFFVKATGALLTLTLGIYLLVRGGMELVRDPRQGRRQLGYAMLSLVLFGAEQGLLRWSGAFEQQQGGRLPLTMAWIWFPDVLLLGIMTAIVWGWGLVKTNRSVERQGFERLGEWLRRWMSSWRSDGEWWCSLMVLSALALAISQVRFVPRYAAFGVPFLYVLLAGGLSRVVPSKVAGGLLLAISVLNLVNWNGSLFPDQTRGLENIAYFPGRALRREGSLLERSHEYLRIHEENLRVTREAAKHAATLVDGADGEMPLVTILPYSLYLKSPVYGVVREPREVYSFYPVGPERVSQIKSLEDFRRDRPRAWIALRDTTTFNFATVKAEVLPPSAEDEVIAAEGESTNELVAYVRRVPADGGWSFDAWLKRAEGVPSLSAARLWSAYRFSGGGGLYSMVQEKSVRSGWEPESSLLSAAGMARAGQWQGLMESLLAGEARTGGLSDRRPVRSFASTNESRDEIACCLDSLVRNDRLAARTWGVEGCISNAPFLRGLLERYRLALDVLDEGDARTAGSMFRDLLKSVPSFWPAEVGLAKVELMQGKEKEGRQRLEEIHSKVPAAFEPLLLLANLPADSEASEAEMKKRLIQYVARYPDSPEVLGWLYGRKRKERKDDGVPTARLIPGELKRIDRSDVLQPGLPSEGDGVDGG